MIPKRLSRDVIYESEWVTLYADEVQFPDGYILDKYHVIHYEHESVAMVIQNEKDEVLMIKSNRYISQRIEWEIPAGRVDDGENPVNAAKREALEETGYSITDPEFVYRYNPTNGSSDQVFNIFKAYAIKKDAQFDTNEVSDIAWMSKKQIAEMLQNNELHCGFSLTGLLLVLFFGK